MHIFYLLARVAANLARQHEFCGDPHGAVGDGGVQEKRDVTGRVLINEAVIHRIRVERGQHT